MLCIWHIINNIVVNCSKYFDEQEEFDAFRKDWERVMYAATEEVFEHEWDALQDDYTDEYPFATQYIAEKLIPRTKKFVTFWTNQNLHSNNRATSRGESNNGKLKRHLGGSTFV